MTTYPKILNTNEIREFDTPPVFKKDDRKIFFVIPKFLEKNLEKIEKDENKLVFILLSIYFDKCKKIFSINTFSIKDIHYIANKYNLNTQMASK